MPANLLEEITDLEASKKIVATKATIRWSPRSQPGKTASATLHFSSGVSLYDILTKAHLRRGRIFDAMDVEIDKLEMSDRTTSIEMNNIQYIPGGVRNERDPRCVKVRTAAGKKANPINVEALGAINFCICPDFPARLKKAA